MTEREARAILDRMGEPYGRDDVAEIMSGDAWYPQSDDEWLHWFGHGVNPYRPCPCAGRTPAPSGDPWSPLVAEHVGDQGRP